MNNMLQRIRKFIARERFYVLLLSFVVMVQVGAYLAERIAPPEAEKQEVVVQEKIESQTEQPSNDEDMRNQLQEAFAERPRLAMVFGLLMGIIALAFLMGLCVDILMLYKSERFQIMGNFAGVPYVAWSIWDVAKVAILFLFFGHALIIAESGFSAIFPFLEVDNVRMILNSTIMDGLAIFFIIYIIRKEYGEDLSKLGISFKNFFKNIFVGVLSYIAAVPILIGLLLLVIFVVKLTHYEPPPQPILELLVKEESQKLFLYSIFFVAMIGPILEEIFFRGFMYTAIKKRFGMWGALLITSFLFSALHANWVGFLPIMALGMLLAYLYEKTGSLSASIAVHIMHNFGMSLFILFIRELGVRGI
ncbi:MAG: CPBP family intramembrane metalloprotease [Candidatus Omnitrophica bacterium]|nr:CPBP family intramembrane metalloprotease [Candidatus Omnitrophota bacterium]